MSDVYLGACVVLTLLPNALPDKVAGGQHVTLVYLGDTPLSEEEFGQLLDAVSDSLDKYGVPKPLKVKGKEYFGEDGDAAVVTLDDSAESDSVYLRKEILKNLSPSLYEIFKEAETFPTYKPHMTMGYISKGYSDKEVELPEELHIDSIEVWHGDRRVSFNLANELAHIGMPRRSGRYPWGSGENPYQGSKTFLGMVAELEEKGLTEKEVAEGMAINTRELRQYKALAKVQIRKDQESQALKLKEKNWSNVAIGEYLGINESSVRNLLNPVMRERRSLVENTAEKLKSELKDGSFIDIGQGSELYLPGVSRTTLKNAVTWLEAEGYKVQYLREPQVGGKGKLTSILVLTNPDVEWKDMAENRHKLKTLNSSTDDGGKTWVEPVPPRNLDSKRIEVRYGPDGGSDMDGVIELRPGVEDLSMGNSRYAQVRVAVDGSHYLKGMAVYSNDLPDGVDVRFNTNKERSTDKYSAMKKMGDDPTNPWGAVIKADGQRGVLNIMNEEGDWSEWSSKLSSQMLSKQTHGLAKQQLDLTFDLKKAEYEGILELNNPTIKKHLLEKFADGADSSAVYLKAKGLPQTQNHVLLPVPSMKESEIYAPQYKNGDRVVLIRHPHGGIFEIPELTVNNRNRAARGIIGTAIDAVGINPKVAEQLSGADFDGDTVLVIPNRQGTSKIQTKKPLKDLEGFDYRALYGHTSKREEKRPNSDKVSIFYTRNGKEFKGMENTQTEMGQISNLITDMTIIGANDSEVARAVKHSMVVIDAEKHGLDYRQSYIDNGIGQLKKKYQGSVRGGASTLISQAKSKVMVDKRRPARVGEGGAIDPETGRKNFVPTGESFIGRDGSLVVPKQGSTKMAETDDAFTLSSGTPIEAIYANHANKLKDLANEARKEMLATPPLRYSPTARETYKKEVGGLDGKLTEAKKNAPLERKAQLLANAAIRQKKADNPHMDSDTLKKEEHKALALYRARTGAGKTRINITDREWEAIQAGAVSNNKLKQILNNSDVEQIKKLATPRTQTGITPGMLARARSMLAAGYTQAEIASSLGVSTSTINKAMKG